MSKTRDDICIRSIFMLIPWLIKLFIADLLLSVLLPLSVILPDKCYDLASGLANWIWMSLQDVFTHANGAEIILSGANDLPRDESAIVVSNHVAWADIYMIQQLAIGSNMLGRCRWFAKQQLKWVPFLGWGLWAMGMPLVSRKWTHDEKEVHRVFKGVLKRGWPICTRAVRLNSSSLVHADNRTYFKGLSRTAKARDILLRRDSKLRGGAKPTINDWEGTYCTHAPKDS